MKKKIVAIEAETPSFLNPDSRNYDSRLVVKYGYIYMYSNEEVFLQGSLEIQQTELNELIEWILWVRIPASKFISETESLQNPITSMEATLFSPVFSYEKTKGLKVRLEFDMRDEIKLPSIIILDNHEELYTDFTNGMQKDKYVALQRKFGLKLI